MGHEDISNLTINDKLFSLHRFMSFCRVGTGLSDDELVSKLKSLPNQCLGEKDIREDLQCLVTNNLSVFHLVLGNSNLSLIMHML